MREIKFRVWDVSRKKMSAPYDPTATAHYHRFSDIFMQYTGLKDKNGKEIYEGDLVKSNKGIVYEVFWDGSRARYSVKTGNKWNNKEINPYVYKSLVWAVGRVEVIGNIYENPEFMKGKAK